MSIISFIKEAGEKLFGHRDSAPAAAPAADPAALQAKAADANQTAAKAIEKYIASQNLSADGKSTDITFTVQEAELDRALEVLKTVKKDIGAFDIKSSSDVAKVSVIGIGMRSHAGVAAQMFKALGDRGINILAISTSEIKISVLIDATKSGESWNGCSR